MFLKTISKLLVFNFATFFYEEKIQNKTNNEKLIVLTGLISSIVATWVRIYATEQEKRLEHLLNENIFYIIIPIVTLFTSQKVINTIYQQGCIFP